MKKQLLYLMFTMAIMCIACSDDNEIYQTETVENPVTGFSIENDLLTEEGVITLEGLGTTTTLQEAYRFASSASLTKPLMMIPFPGCSKALISSVTLEPTT